MTFGVWPAQLYSVLLQFYFKSLLLFFFFTVFSLVFYSYIHAPLLRVHTRFFGCLLCLLFFVFFFFWLNKIIILSRNNKSNEKKSQLYQNPTNFFTIDGDSFKNTRISYLYGSVICTALILAKLSTHLLISL